jgi:hypothetical protein
MKSLLVMVNCISFAKNARCGRDDWRDEWRIGVLWAIDDSNLDAMIPTRSVLAVRAISDRLAGARHGATDR